MLNRKNAGIAAVAVACLFGSMAMAVGASTADRASELQSTFPLIEGAVWTYDGTSGGRRVATITTKLGEVTNSAGTVSAQAVNMTNLIDGPADKRVNSVTVRYEKTGGEVRSIYPGRDVEVLQSLPLTQGATWTYKGGKTAVERVDVATPFKTFAGAYKVSSRTEAGSTETMWFAQGVGLIKYVVVRPDGTQTSLDLTGFSAP